MSEPTVNLYLVGFMGTGKTTVGRAVAMRLGFQALDSDYEIERRAGRTVAQIFARDGEAAFRAMERKFIESGHSDRGVVVACGGGLVVPAGMLELLRAKGVVICLHATPETILQRTAPARVRPLLEVADPEVRIRQLFAEREETYKRAGTVILTDFRPLHDVVMHVLRAYRREARDWERAHGGGAPRPDDVGPISAPASTAKTGRADPADQ
ncbi:MAG TPA: shikimate kinase [Opitutaceae bacterium]|nr:shikimate kinase [Opitutaceae bacterium]